MDILFTSSADAAEQSEWLAALGAQLPEAIWHRHVDDANRHRIEIAVVANPAPGSLQGLPALKLIQSLWAGVDRLLDDPTLPGQVAVARMVDPAMSEAMAQTALWATIALHRHFFAYAQAQRSECWQPLPQRRAAQIAVAVLGMGQMGRCCALRLAAAGYRVTGWQLTARPAADAVPTVAGGEALPALLGASDVVINLLPLTDQTRGLFDRERFAMMRPGAALVNLARGAHVVQADLQAALASGQVGHAVLDVFDSEPLPAGHAFWQHPRVTVLPHVAALTDVHSASALAARNLRACLAGEPVANLVDRRRGY